MRFISNFREFDTINEATLNDTKIDVDYILSRQGRATITKFGVTENMILTFTRDVPDDDIDVLWIRPSSIQKVKFSDLKLKLNISSNDELMIYKTSSKKFPWAIAKHGIRTDMVKQKEKEGSAKRGDHFRESAFIITLAIESWNMKRIKIPVMTNRGPVEMTYYNNGTANISEKERGGFRKEYDLFMVGNKQAVAAMIDQCKKLVEWLGDNIRNVAYFTKNTTDLLINQAASAYLKDESQYSSIPDNEGDDYGALDLPKRLTMAKWNPSDMWIVFKGSEWVMEDFDGYEKKDISDIDDLNELLAKSILYKNGLIGVSLKQSSNVGILSIVNMDTSKASHKYDGYDIRNSVKNATIKFSYKFGDNANFVGNSEIHCRTFDATNKSSISLEVKGSKKAKHMSGKAGSILESIMPSNYYKIIEFIRLSTDKDDILRYIDTQGFQLRRDLNDIFYNDINDGDIKTPNQNSRLQSVIVLQWISSLNPQQANSVITKIVRFAKSESSWSAPHLIAK